MRSLDMCRQGVIAGNPAFGSSEPALAGEPDGRQKPARRTRAVYLSGSVMLRTLATAAAADTGDCAPSRILDRADGGKACEAPVSCFGRG